MDHVLTIAKPALADLLKVAVHEVETLARNVIESFLLDAEQALVDVINKKL